MLREMQHRLDSGKVAALPSDELLLTDLSNFDIDDHCPIASVYDATTIVESHRSNAKESSSGGGGEQDQSLS